MRSRGNRIVCPSSLSLLFVGTKIASSRDLGLRASVRDVITTNPEISTSNERVRYRFMVTKPVGWSIMGQPFLQADSFKMGPLGRKLVRNI